MSERFSVDCGRASSDEVNKWSDYGVASVKRNEGPALAVLNEITFTSTRGECDTKAKVVKAYQ